MSTLAGAWWTIWAVIDVRGWTWRSYAVVCVVMIAALVFIKIRQGNA